MSTNNHHVTLIAECGVSWFDITEAKEMVRLAKAAGCDKAKFQMYNAETISKSPTELKKRLESVMLDESKAGELIDQGKTAGIEVFFTPMYVEAVDILERLHVETYKIRELDSRPIQGESSLQNNPDMTPPIIDRVLKTGKHVYISVQNKPLTSMFFRFHPRITWMYCNPTYPPKLEDVEVWKAGVYEGISNHYPSVLVPYTAAVLGATTIECHLMLNDGLYRERPERLDRWVSMVYNNFCELRHYLDNLEKMNYVDPLKKEWENGRLF